MSTERLDALLDKVEEIVPGTKAKLLIEALNEPWLDAVAHWFWDSFLALPWETKPLVRKRECRFCRQMMMKDEVAVHVYGFKAFRFHPDCFPKMAALERIGMELEEVITEARRKEDRNAT